MAWRHSPRSLSAAGAFGDGASRLGLCDRGRVFIFALVSDSRHTEQVPLSLAELGARMLPLQGLYVSAGQEALS
jgi:hypothetical protein